MHLKSIRFLPERYPTQEHYPFTLPLLQQTEALTFDSPITFFVGENGSGKTTLLEGVAGACGIHIWRSPWARRVNFNPFEGALAQCLEPEWSPDRVPGAFFSSQSHRDFANLVEEWAAADPGQLAYVGGRSLVTSSHGESVMALLRSRYQGRGLYLADEPETALSPVRQLELVRLLRDTAREGKAQFLIATHSPILLACPGATLYSLDDAPPTRVAYEETQYFQVYRSFLNDRSAYLGTAT